MTSPDDKDPIRSELEYAPPWVREQVAREQGTREQAPREQAPREQITRDQFRATLRQSAGAAIKQLAPNNPESRSFGDDRPWHQRALEPELVPGPPAGASNLWPMILRLGAVCGIAAIVAAAVVFLFNPKQIAHKIAQADTSAPATISDDAAPSSIESSRGVPALTAETSAGATTQPTPQMPQAQTPQAQVAAATPPQLGEGQVAAPPPQPEKSAEPAPAQQLALLPAPDSSPADIRPATAPAVNEPAPRPVDANPAPLPAPVQTAPIQAAPPSVAQPAVVLDQNEIDTLIRRGKNLLNDGDFAAARVLFERAANAGSAEAALALGSTYDPNVIKRLGAIMVKPDVEKARKWYQLAADRGSAAASLQLANLPQSR
jgi:Sel1 repeat-containing protein